MTVSSLLRSMAVGTRQPVRGKIFYELLSLLFCVAVPLRARPMTGMGRGTEAR